MNEAIITETEIGEIGGDGLIEESMVEKEKALHKLNFNKLLDTKCENNITKILNVAEGDRLLRILDGKMHCKNANEKFIIKNKNMFFIRKQME